MAEKVTLMNKPDPGTISLCSFKTRGPVLTLTVGLPASGKTTFARTAGFGLAISLDDCRELLWGDRKKQYGPGGIDALLTLQQTIITGAMRENKSIIVDNTGILKEHRTPLIETAEKHGYATQIVYFDVPYEECIRRNEARDDAVPAEIMESFALKIEVPAVDEAGLVIRYSMLSL
jgi:predicted kinase